MSRPVCPLPANFLVNKPKEPSHLLPRLLHRFQTKKQRSVWMCYNAVKARVESWWVEQTTRNKEQHQRLGSFMKTNAFEIRRSSQFTTKDFRRESSNNYCHKSDKVCGSMSDTVGLPGPTVVKPKSTKSTTIIYDPIRWLSLGPCCVNTATYS